MSNMLEIFAEMVNVVADNPASILIILGFLGILIAIFFPMGLGAQLMIGCTGFLMLVAGIFVHVMWLNK
jgi:hypothetical protein